MKIKLGDENCCCHVSESVRVDEKCSVRWPSCAPGEVATYYQHKPSFWDNMSVYIFDNPLYEKLERVERAGATAQ